MRVVIYDPSDLEALTVIWVPPDVIRDFERGKFGLRPIYRFSVPVELDFPPLPYDPVEQAAPPIATVRFDRMHYGSGSQRLNTWIGFALTPVICLRMRSELLPGQRGDAIRREEIAFIRGLTAAFR